MRTLPVLALLALAACHGPESSRNRGGGPGGDIGNRGDVVRMHEGSRPYHGTPRLVAEQVPPRPPAGPASAAARPDRP